MSLKPVGCVSGSRPAARCQLGGLGQGPHLRLFPRGWLGPYCCGGWGAAGARQPRWRGQIRIPGVFLTRSLCKGEWGPQNTKPDDSPLALPGPQRCRVFWFFLYLDPAERPGGRLASATQAGAWPGSHRLVLQSLPLSLSSQSAPSPPTTALHTQTPAGSQGRRKGCCELHPLTPAQDPHPGGSPARLAASTPAPRPCSLLGIREFTEASRHRLPPAETSRGPRGLGPPGLHPLGY